MRRAAIGGNFSSVGNTGWDCRSALQNGVPDQTSADSATPKTTSGLD